MKRIYFPINEETARTAKELNSFGDYVPGSATAHYRDMCDDVYNAAEDIAQRLPYLAEKAEAKAQNYAKKLAEYYNDYYRNEASCPSVMICGPANFPTRKKEKQNSRRDTLQQEFQNLQDYAASIKAMGTGGISADDPNALERLRQKLDILEAARERMKKINAHFRKYQTMEGYPEPLTEQEKQHISFMVNSGFSKYGIYDTSNISATIRSTKERLERLEAQKAQETKETETEFCTVMENTEIMRLQLIFPDKPDEETRNILKRNGFRWSPKNGAWQRQLTNNAKYAAQNVLNALAPINQQ